MGCCQNINCSIEEQFTIEHLSVQEKGKMKSAQRGNLLLQESQKMKIFPNLVEDPKNFYTVSSEIYSDGTMNKFLCVHSFGNDPQEVILIKKSCFYKSDYEDLEVCCGKLLNFSHENIVKITNLIKTEGSLQVFTEPCGLKTLSSVLNTSRIPFGPALTFATQITKALLHMQKLGISGKNISENDIFIIKNSLKVSISCMIPKEKNDFLLDFSQSKHPEVFSLGIILIKLFIAPTNFTTIEEGLEKLELMKVDSQDIKYLMKMVKGKRKQPTLMEVSMHAWNTSSSSFFSKEFSKELNEIEKISEEVSSSLLESWDFSEDDEYSKNDLNLVSKNEKSIALPTMESLTGN